MISALQDCPDEEGGMTSSFNPIMADMHIPTLMLSLR